MSRLRISLLAVPVVLVALGAGALSAAASPAPPGATLFPSRCTNESFEPKGIVVACADDGIFTKRMQWSSWTRHHAEGKGVAHINTCNPSCSAGNFKKAPATVRLSETKRCGANRQFTLLKIRYNKPVSGPQRQSYPFPCAT